MRRSIVLLTIIALLTSVGAVALAAGTPQAVFDDYKQCANGAPGVVSLSCPAGWINGILQASNSHYREDQVTPQRLAVHVPKGQTPLTGRTVVLRYQTRKGGATGGNHSYDSLTTWNLTQTGANGCDGLSALPVCTGGNPVGAASTFNIPADGVAVPPCAPAGCSAITSAHQIPGVMTMYGGTITNVAYGGTVGNATYPPHDNPTGSNDDYATVTVTYSVASTATQDRSVLLLFGGHLAPGGGPRSWGTGLGAANINGGPYHIKLAGLDNASAGNRDNQISAGAILGFATITSTKSASPNPANVGQTVTYTIQLSNSGNATGTTNVVDTYDKSHITIVPNSISNGGVNDANAGTITWTGISVPPGVNTVTLTYQGVVGGTFSGGNDPCNPGQFPVVNTVTLSNGAGTSNTLCVNASPSFTITKSASPTTTNPGGTVTYTVTVTNNGTAAGSTSFNDVYDSRITITSVPAGCTNTVATHTLSCTTGTINPGGSQSFVYTATMPTSFTGTPGGGPCTNTQFRVQNTATLVTGGTPATSDVCVNASPSFTITKSASPTTTNPGGTVTYTVTVTNNGTAAGSTSFNDVYDSRITITSVPAGCTNTVATHTLSCTTGTINPGGSQSFVYTATMPTSFTGTPGGGPCTNTQFRVQNTATLVTGGTPATSDVCVNASPSFTITKSASPTTTNPGGTVTYTVTVTNGGSAPGSTSFNDVYDSRITITSVPAGCTNSTVNHTLTCTTGTLNPGGSQSFVYTATMPTSFTGTPGGGPCTNTQFRVQNTATLVTGGTPATSDVCVNVSPNLTLGKAADKTSAGPDQLITYTLTYGNTGSAPATNTTITEPIPAGTSFESCTGSTGTTGDCTLANNTVTWNIGTVNPGATGSVTLTVRVLSSAGCEISNVAFIQAANNPQTQSNGGVPLVVTNTPGPNPGGAFASGNATGAFVQSSLLSLTQTLPAGNDGAGDFTSVDSVQSGVGSNGESNQLLAVDVPPPSPGSVLHADVLRTETVSTITSVPAESTASSVGSAANVNILNGLVPGFPSVVSATLVRGVARATGTGTSVNVSSLGSAIEGLSVLGIPQAVYPGARVDLPAAIFGPDSYVAIYEEIKSTSTPTGTSGGVYSGDITVNMIRVHITNMLIAGQVEVIVGHAKANTAFPQTTLCGPQANQSISGHAFMVRALTDPTILPVIIGAVELPTSGGTFVNSVNQAVVDPVVTTKTATSSTTGSFTPFVTTASSYAEAKSVCVLKTGNVCTIAAQLVRAQANSTAASGTRSSDSNGTDFVGLKIGGVVVSLPVAANTVIGIPGIGVVILNEQFCDNGGTLALNCSNGTVPGHTGLTVRAIHVILLDPAAGGTPGVDIIVSEAHSDARFA